MITVEKLGALLCTLILPLWAMGSTMINPPDTISTSVSICEGEEYNGVIFENSSFFYEYSTDLNGDTITVFEVDLMVNPEIRTTIRASICGSSNVAGYTAPGIYEDVFTSFSGCDSVRVLELSSLEVYIPNVFTPNGDGVNDFFTLHTGDSGSYRINSFSLFSRAGDRIVNLENIPLSNYNQLWDGKMKEQFMLPGAYAFYMEISDETGENLCPVSGNITLIR